MQLSWFITTTTYGSWLPGDSRGSVDSDHHQLGEQLADPNLALEQWSRRQLKCEPIRLQVDQAAALLAQLHETAKHRNWSIHAVAIMATHWHAVVSASELVESERILGDLKSYGSRCLSKRWGKPISETWWTQGGSRRRLSDDGNVESAVRYVARQEFPLILWVHPEFEGLVPDVRREMAVDRWRDPTNSRSSSTPRPVGAEDVSPPVANTTGLTIPSQADSEEPAGLRPPLRNNDRAQPLTNVGADDVSPPATNTTGLTIPSQADSEEPAGLRPPLRSNDRAQPLTNVGAEDVSPPAANTTGLTIPSQADSEEPAGLHPPLRRSFRKDSERLRRLDNAHVWHPFTAMSAYRDEQAPIIVDADGFFLIDSEGRKYLDGHSSLWCNIHGHRVPAIDNAIQNQLGRVAHSTLLGLSNEPSIELAAELVRRVPAGLNKVFYTDCGAAGVEAALKIAFQYHRQKAGGSQERNLFACLGQAYHGDTVGTISLGGIDRFHSLFGSLMFPALRIPTPGGRRSSQSSQHQPSDQEHAIAQLEKLLAEHADQLAGFVIEPLVQAAAGILVHPPGYLRRVRELTRQHGILLIADEIAVGFGRTGRLFACEHEDVSPDILILSKGLTGGYLPLAATLVTDEIYDAFLGDPWARRTFQHGHTYTGNPLACAAALASMRLIDENHVLDNVRLIEQTLRRELVPLSGLSAPVIPVQHHISDVRQCGAMVGIDLMLDCVSQTPFAPELRMGHQVTLACRRRGLILRNIGDTIVLMPAPAMPPELVAHLCRTVVEAIVEVLTTSVQAFDSLR